MRNPVLALGLVLWLASSALAWNATGHKLISSLAFRQLTREEQQRVVALLKRHPRFTPDFADEMPDDVKSADVAAQDEWLFQQAGIWSDIVRGGPPERTAFHRPTWHYVDVPHFLEDKSRAELEAGIKENLALVPPPAATPDTQELNVTQAIALACRLIADQNTSPEVRGLMLAWLFHLVGDLHQPCHSTGLFSRRLFAEGDQGGNKIKLTQSYNLHALWDGFLGQDADFRAVRNRAIALAVDQQATATGQAAAKQLNARTWRDESHLLAVTAVYDPALMMDLRQAEAGTGELAPLTLPEEYLRMGGRLSQRRAIQAGYRLAAVIKAVTVP
jgi:S1/P1 nuclease